jgi:type I restriction enzyme R subunit
MLEQPSSTPSSSEERITRVAVLRLLQNLGYGYLRQREVHLEREGNLSNVLLEEVLESQLRRLNRINFKGQEREFSDANIQAAILALKNAAATDGLIRANERVYNLLSLGKSFEQKIDGDAKSFTLRYIDWARPETNVFHVTEEFEVEGAGGRGARCLDIALFVNGIPFALIGCKKTGDKNAIEAAISRHSLNQRDDSMPHLYAYSQLLVAIDADEAKYATTGTRAQYWSRWKEQADVTEELRDLVNRPIAKEQKGRLFADRVAHSQRHYDELNVEDRPVSDRDKAIYCLLRPERLIELARQFVVFDGGRKKIARPQQYFAVKKTIDKIKRVDADGRRAGGVIWHTQGSGKTLTMVMLAKALALEENVSDPRIVLVTDRIELDEQIWGAFHSCGKEPVKATTGRHLLELLSQNKFAVITTVIDKFATAVKTSNYQNTSNDIFALVDESHRGQYGEAGARMRRTLPNACYIGFTGTPLKKKDKNTAVRFGGFIDAYTIDQAVRDKAITPLLYEGRHVPQEIDRAAIDAWFERMAGPLTADQRRDLKRKISSPTRLNQADRRIYMIAADISDHFAKNVPKPFKAQLATGSKLAALKYKQCLDEIGSVSSEVLISGPDTREGADLRAGNAEIQGFWKRMMERYGAEREYNRAVIEAFNKNDQPEILIVVDKLLTGFDAPRNTVLYLDKMLKEHGLLQAIARVNRLHEGKEFGLIIDYFGVFCELRQALDLYSSFPEFEPDDLALTLADIDQEAAKLPLRHDELREIFTGAERPPTPEVFEELLSDDALRERFYASFSAFNRAMGVAFSSAKFLVARSNQELERYKEELIFFQKLRMRVKRRYADEMDFGEYEARAQALINKHVSAAEVLQITPLTSVFDREKFQAEVDSLESAAAKADTIAYRAKMAIAEKLEEDPFYLRQLSKILEEVISAWRERRLSDVEYLSKAQEVWGALKDSATDALPPELNDREAARAFYEVVNGVFTRMGVPSADARMISVEAALEIDGIVQKNKIVDWASNVDAQNEISNQIDDYLYLLKEQRGIDMSFEEMDRIINESIEIAKNKYA